MKRTESPPSAATTAFIETGGSQVESMRRRTATPTAAMTAIRRTIGMKSRASQALPPAPGTLPEKPPAPETSTPNQSKNMNMKRRIPETAATFSPVLSLSASIYTSSKA